MASASCVDRFKPGLAMFGALGLMNVVGAQAQPADLPIAPATTDEYPAGVSVAQTDLGPAYVDAQGRTLYGMDMRILLRSSPDPSRHCTGQCARDWEPLLPPAGTKVNIEYPLGFSSALYARIAGSPDDKLQGRPSRDSVKPGFVNPQKAPDWTVIEGAQGPQWVYKGWHLVFTRRGDQPRSTAFEGSDDKTWNTLKYIPPVPDITAPGNVTTKFVDGDYALTDSEGRLLYTGICKQDCQSWNPFVGGMASLPVGKWTIARNSDTAQWTYRGKPVFVSASPDAQGLPAAGTVLRP
ncbi:MAG: hypothetical protein KDE55_15280 [Novosphingobium sp.]|nr:hypothetical protein [Novosphingobium sp.]